MQACMKPRWPVASNAPVTHSIKGITLRSAARGPLPLSPLSPISMPTLFGNQGAKYPITILAMVTEMKPTVNEIHGTGCDQTPFGLSAFAVPSSGDWYGFSSISE